MIGRISGTLLEKNPPQVLVDAQGVGYEIDVPMSTFYNLPNLGEKVMLFTHLVVREDAQLLFGFATDAERKVFRQLLKVSGIGARTALSVLSGMSVGELAQAITMQDVGRLTRVPGIGKKTAERLLLELKGKLGVELASSIDVHRPPSAGSDVMNALLALGYNEKEALAATRQLPAEASVADGETVGQLLDHRERLLVAVAERRERVEDIRRHRGGAVDADDRAELDAELVLELEEQPLRGLLADAGDLRQAAALLHRHRLRELGHRQPGEHRQRGARADAGDLQQLAEGAALGLAAEAVEQVRVLADDEVREQHHALACAICHAHGGQGLGKLATAGYRMKRGRLV